MDHTAKNDRINSLKEVLTRVESLMKRRHAEVVGYESRNRENQVVGLNSLFNPVSRKLKVHFGMMITRTVHLDLRIHQRSLSYLGARRSQILATIATLESEIASDPSNTPEINS